MVQANILKKSKSDTAEGNINVTEIFQAAHFTVLLLFLILFAFICAAFFQQRRMAMDALFSTDHTDTCHSEVTNQVYHLFSEIVLREPSATRGLEVTCHKRQTTAFREGTVRIIALSLMSKWKSRRRGKKILL